MKGDTPEAADTSKFCEYSTHGRQVLQAVGCQAATHQRVFSMDWFILSIWPLDWGW